MGMLLSTKRIEELWQQEHEKKFIEVDSLAEVGDLEPVRALLKEQLRELAKWLKKYDTYTQYTGRDHEHLVRRLDIPNEEIYALYEEAK